MSASETTTAERLNQKYFNAYFAMSNAEEALDEAVLRAFGADPDKTETWPCGDLAYDWYDNSFELHGTRDDFVPTQEHANAVHEATGLTHGWINFVDGTEIHVGVKYGVAERKTSFHKGRSEGKRLKRAALNAALSAVEARATAAEQERTCHWAQDNDPDDGRYWDTQCGEAYMLIDGDFDENRHRYCPFCGGRIVQKLAALLSAGDPAPRRGDGD